ncbi:Rho GTPase-activating protein gacZ [Rhizoctonia solani]|uniref:Rho GTPase-activating protein gacZ n=1 Tax=Rhizoctonia solani TaxID=456999 RepID=A0A8H8P5H1_9AGAM|nr:Rho GTPase-activating protein gacZ [Rhizoctonia solani]QRW24261.1 Rho GTPase-activating protein gacZ [Rhizoctonia solani]
MSVRALPAVPGASSSTTTLSPPGLDSRSASVSSLATNPAIRPLPALPPSHSQVSLAATTTSASTVRPLPVPQPAANMNTASLLSVDEAPLGSAGAPVRDPVEENSCLGDRTVNVLAPPRTVSNQDLSGHGSASDSQLQPTATTTEASQSTATLPHLVRIPRFVRPALPYLELGLDTAIPDHTVQAVAARPAEQEKTPTVSGLAQVWRHHMQTQQQHLSGASLRLKMLSPRPLGNPRLNLGLFSSRARKESNRGTVYEERSAGSEASTTTTEDPTCSAPMQTAYENEEATTGMFRSPSPSSGPGAVGMRKAASAGAGPIVSAASNDLSSSAAGSSTETPALSCDKPNALAQPTKPLKLKSQAQGLLNTAIGIGMSLGGRGSINVMPTSPSIAAALEYMRNEHDPPRRSVLDEKRDEHGVYGAESTGEGNGEENDGAGSRERGASRSREHLGEGSGDRSIGGNGLRERLANANESREDLTRSSGDTFDDESDAESQKVHGQPSISDFASKGHKASFSDAGKSSFRIRAQRRRVLRRAAHTDADDHPSHAVDTGSTDDHLVVHDEEDQHEADASFSSEPCFDQAFSFNPSARPQPRAAQDPDKRVSTASSQRTLTAWNTGGFVFPNNNANAEQQQGGAPLARLHTTDGNLDVEHEVESEPLPKPTPRPARLGQLAGSLKRRSASMSILLPPMMSPRSPGPESEASSPGLMPTSPPPPMPTRHAHFDGAVTDSEGTAPVRKRSRRHRPKKHTNREAEPRRSDSPHHQGSVFHSPASAPALQVHTHVHIPQLPAAAQTPLMSIAALAPAARDLALGVGKRVEKFYRARSASGAGHEQRPSLGGMRTTSSTGRGAHTNAHANTHANTIGLGLGVEPVLSAPLRPAVPGASGLVFGRALEDPSVPRDMDGWTDEILGVRRCVGLPVFVSRSVRHLERWGGDEEGLFRISGRPSHVSRLRAEFDAGADYDLYEIPPSDLDPHAVSSLFKAYLRQLPEPILTRALKGQFDMAMTATDSTSNASFDISKLPTSMTSFGESSENMRSLDDALLADIKVLIDHYPKPTITSCTSSVIYCDIPPNMRTRPRCRSGTCFCCFARRWGSALGS